jgi:hypothetical protein
VPDFVLSRFRFRYAVVYKIEMPVSIDFYWTRHSPAVAVHVMLVRTLNNEMVQRMLVKSPQFLDPIVVPHHSHSHFNYIKKLAQFEEE